MIHSYTLPVITHLCKSQHDFQVGFYNVLAISYSSKPGEFIYLRGNLEKLLIFLGFLWHLLVPETPLSSVCDQWLLQRKYYCGTQKILFSFWQDIILVLLLISYVQIYQKPHLPRPGHSDLNFQVVN